jgi:hypothetical protein
MMEANFVALVPRYKFESGPTLLLTCDKAGICWIRDKFRGLRSAGAGTGFTIGDGNLISSDGKCRITVSQPREGSSEIVQSGPMDFTWQVCVEDARMAVDKLNSLARSGTPGHQYLDVAKGFVRTVVVTKDEEPVDVVRAMRDDR